MFFLQMVRFYDEWSDGSSEEDEEWDEEEDLAILMMVEMEQNKRPKHGGSRVGREVIHRRRQEGHQRLVLDYFGVSGTPPTYPERYFRRRFRMGMELFQHICWGPVLESTQCSRHREASCDQRRKRVSRYARLC